MGRPRLEDIADELIRTRYNLYSMRYHVFSLEGNEGRDWDARVKGADGTAYAVMLADRKRTYKAARDAYTRQPATSRRRIRDMMPPGFKP